MLYFWQKLLFFLFPQPCVVCGYLGEALCSRCRSALVCYPHVRKLEGLQVASALYYQNGDVLGQLIHPLKYEHQYDLIRFLLPPLVQALQLLLDPSQVVLVPVPLHLKREHERGYNQAELLARGLGNWIGAPVLAGLKRVRHTQSQVSVQTREERAQNLVGAFEWTGPLPKDGQIVLVDDIVTTGSTLLACAEALRRAGAKDLVALTLADRNEAPTPPWHRCLPQCSCGPHRG